MSCTCWHCEDTSDVPDMGTITITKITLLRLRGGPDTLSFQTSLPSGIWPFRGPATAKMDVARGKGEEYCEKHFPGVPVETIEVA